MALCYRYNENKEYIGSEEMYKDPLESELQKKDIWLLPEDCTLIEPPEAKEGFLIVWNGDAWEYKEFEKEPEPYVPTEDELKAQVRSVRNHYLEQTDKYMITDYPITDDERELCKQYREYLRIYTEANLWYESNPFTFDEWKKLTRVTDTEDLYEQKAMTFDEWKQASELEQIVASGD